jgi:hypothetical protein
LARKKIATRKSASKKSKKKSRSKYKWPKAFRLVPLRLKSRIQRHAHLAGQPGIPPCPPNSTFSTYVDIDGLRFCMYLVVGGPPCFVLCL